MRGEPLLSPVGCGEQGKGDDHFPVVARKRSGSEHAAVKEAQADMCIHFATLTGKHCVFIYF